MLRKQETMFEEDALTRYYLAQAGSGMGEFYSGPIYQQTAVETGSLQTHRPVTSLSNAGPIEFLVNAYIYM